MDDITPLEHLSASVLAADAHLFPIRRATSLNVHRPQGWTPGEFMAPNAPTGAMVRYHLARDLEGAEGVAVTAASDNGDNGRSGRGRGAEDQGAEVVLTILDQDGSVVRELAGPGTAGLHQVVWDLRVEPAFESDDEEERSFYRRGVSPRGPRVLPGTYTVRLQAGDERRQMDVPVRLDPRIDISDADLRARQDAMMSAFALAGPIHEGTEAIDRLEGQLEEVEALLDEHAGAPDALVAEVSAFLEDLSELREDLEDASDGARASWSIEASTTAPTADQLWQIDQSWNRVPAMIERLNDYITERMPAINRQLDEQGVRPDPGGPVAVPRRSGDA
jgi:hypothetical protein